MLQSGGTLLNEEKNVIRNVHENVTTVEYLHGPHFTFTHLQSIKQSMKIFNNQLTVCNRVQ